VLYVGLEFVPQGSSSVKATLQRDVFFEPRTLEFYFVVSWQYSGGFQSQVWRQLSITMWFQLSHSISDVESVSSASHFSSLTQHDSHDIV